MLQKADSIGGDPDGALLAVFVKVLNEMQGYYAKQDYIALFEHQLATTGKLAGFKETYQRVSGRSWEDDLDLIDNLGVSDLFRIVHCDKPEATDYQESIEASPNACKLELSKHCLEAHKILMELNPENAAKFKDVAKYFEEEVKKGSGEPS